MDVKLWFLTVAEEHGLRVIQKRVVRMFGPGEMKRKEVGENCIMRSFISCPLRKM
jgi:hypothetical protein